MARYATGIHANAICDKCGLSYPYLSLKAEWNGLRTCPECWDAKHPALEPVTAVDSEALRFARPSTHKREDARAVILSGVTASFTMGEDGQNLISSGVAISETGVSTTFSLGTEIPTAAATPSGISATFSLGTESIFTGVDVSVSGIAITTSLGNESLVLATYAAPNGIAVTTTVGNETIRADVTLTTTGFPINSALGNETPQAAAIESGFAITTALGNESIRLLGWGNNGWGDDNWGHN